MKSDGADSNVIIVLTAFLLSATPVCFAGDSILDCMNGRSFVEKFVSKSQELLTRDRQMSEVYGRLTSQLKGRAKEKEELSQVREVNTSDKGSDPASLTKKLVEAVQQGDVGLAETQLNRGGTRTLRDWTLSRSLFLPFEAATWSW